ncbi:unnamed protein product [Lathyrus oleraceus]
MFFSLFSAYHHLKLWIYDIMRMVFALEEVLYMIMNLKYCQIVNKDFCGVARSGMTKPYRENDTNVFGL